MEPMKLTELYDILYKQLANAGVSSEMVDLTNFAKEDPATSKFVFDWNQVVMRIEDDGDARDSVVEILKSILKTYKLYTPSYTTLVGNMWNFIKKPEYRIFVTTNGTVKQNGAVVMGTGCAKEAKDMFPAIPLFLGELLQKWYKENNTNIPPVMWLKDYNLGVFPVKMQWYFKADLKLIEQSAKTLREMADDNKWTEKIVVPWPGCGNGGLKRQQVEPILAKYFDDRFIVIGLD